MTWATGVSGPWSGATFDADKWALMVASWFPDGVVGDPSTSDLQVYGDSTGMHVKIRVGTGKLIGQWVNATSETTVTIGANGSGNPRIDRVVLRRDPSAGTIEPFVIVGSPGTTPTAPNLTAQDLPLARVAVANAAVTVAAGNVTDDRPFFGLPTIPCLDAAHLPASPRVGQTASYGGLLVWWNGASWVQLQTDTGWSALSTNRGGGHWWIPVVGFEPAIRRVGSLVEVRGQVTLLGTGASATIVTGMPAGDTPATQTSYLAQSTSGVVVTLFAAPSGIITLASSGFNNGTIPVGDALCLDGTWLVG